MRNTSRRLENAKRMEVLENFCTKMSTSGHTAKFMRRALVKGITNYVKKVRRSKLDKDDKNYLPLYQDSKWRRNQKAKGKAMKKSSWYKDVRAQNETSKGGKRKGKKRFQKDGNIQTGTVVFVPSTKGGILTRKLREREEVLAGLTGFRIRFQEAGGTQLANMFSTDLAKGKHCGRKVCPTCTSSDDKKPNCRARSLLYESSCTLCNPVQERKKSSHQEEEIKGRDGIYIGETSRSLNERTNGALSGC